MLLFKTYTDSEQAGCYKLIIKLPSLTKPNENVYCSWGRRGAEISPGVAERERCDFQEEKKVSYQQQMEGKSKFV